MAASKKCAVQSAGLVSVAALVFLLSACAFSVNGYKEAVPVTAESLHLQAGQSPAVAVGWWKQLQQPQLDNLLEAAFRKSPDILVAQARLREAESQWRMEKGEAGLQVSAQARAVDLRLNPAPGVEGADHVFSSRSALLNASYAFDFWGRQRNLIKAALGTRTAAQMEEEQARLLLAQAVVSQYTQLQLTANEQALTLKRLEINRRLQRLLDAQIKAGLLPGNAVYAQARLVLDLQAQLRSLSAEQERLKNSLAVLAGVSPVSFDFHPSPIMGSVPKIGTGGIKADILGRRPDIAAQRSLLQSAYFNVRAAKAEFYPNVSIGGFAGLSHVDAFDLLRSSSRLLALLPAVSLPIFSSGTLQANLAGKQAQYDEQVAIYDKTVLTALQQASDALTAYQAGAQVLDLQHQSQELADKSASSMRRRQQAGLDNGLARLQAEDNALSARMEGLRALAQYRTAWADLQTALGGGFDHSAENSEVPR